MAVSQRGDRTIVFDRATRQVVDMSRNLPGRKRWRDGCLYVEATGDNLEVMLKALPALAEAPLPAVAAYMAAGVAGANIRSRRSAALPPEASAYPFRTAPFDHQREAFGLSRNEKYFAYYMEMGTGKSKLAIDVAGSLWLSGYVDTVIVTAPNGVHRQWVSEAFPTHMSDEVPFAAFAHRAGMRVADKEALQGVLSFDGLRVITIANESLSSKSGQDFLEDLIVQYGPRMLLVIDEVHQFSNPKSARTKFMLRVAPRTAYRRILSGSPITDGIENLFAQFAILSPDILGHRSMTGFQREYCQTEQIYGAPRGAVRIVGYRNLQRLHEKLEGVTYHVTKEDCLDLPEKIYQTVEVGWDKEQKRIYDDLVNHMAAEFGGAEIQAPLAITLLTKLQQVLGGSVLDEDGTEHLVPTRKLEALSNIVEQNTGGIIWVRYLSEARRVAEQLKKMGKSHGVYVGATSADERERLKSRGAVDWLVANEAASTGLDMPWWSLSVYYSNTFNAAVRWQSEDRIHRIGQTQACLYADLVIPGSVDEVVLKALRAKREVADYVWTPEQLLQDTLSLRRD